MKSVKNNTQVLINLRNNHKLLGRVRAFDRHCNMVLENVKELWTEIPKGAGGKEGKPIHRDRVVSKMFLRGACMRVFGVGSMTLAQADTRISLLPTPLRP